MSGAAACVWSRGATVNSQTQSSLEAFTGALSPTPDIGNPRPTAENVEIAEQGSLCVLRSLRFAFRLVRMSSIRRCRILVSASAVACVVACLSGAAPRAQAPSRLALVGGMLITGYEVPPIHHAAVVIEGPRIVAAGPASEVKVPADATLIDTSGRVMLPGLIETHGHLVVLGHGSYETWFPWIARLGAAGAGGAMQVGFGGLNISTSAEAARETERLAAAGVDHIKAHSGLTLDDYKAIVDAAHARRIKVYAHVYAEQDVRHALEAGVDVLQHVGSAGTAPPYSKELITDIVNAGRPVVVTAAHRAWVYPDTAEFPERLQDPELKKAFGADIYAEVQRSLASWWTLGYFQRTDREMLYRERGVKQFIESGAVMGMGTDSGTPMNFHSEALWREIKVHVDMGMTPMRAIAAATRVNAQIIGKGRELGSIEPGKIADLIVVNGNPLFDITALSHVDLVVKDGLVYKGAVAAAVRPPTASRGK